MPKPQFRTPGVLGLDPADAGSTTDPSVDGTQTDADDMPTGPAAFTGVSREAVYREAEEREIDAGKIDQGEASLCGPAVVMYTLAAHRSGLYEGFVKELFEDGDATIGELRVTPGEDCRSHNPGGHIGAADWVALAGLRDSENLVFDYDEWSDTGQGITLPMSIESWLKRMGFGNVRNRTNLYLCKGKSNFMDAVEEQRKGRSVCMLINMDGIWEPDPGRGVFAQLISIPNHWVVLTGVESTHDDNLRFKVFTWGNGDFKVPRITGVKLSMDDWLQNYYGYVSCDG